MMHVAEFVNVFPKIAVILKPAASLEGFLHLGMHASFVMVQVACIRMALSQIQNLVVANNRLLSFPNAKIKDWVR